MNISGSKYQLFNQNIRNKKVRLEIYDFNNHLLDTLDTYVINGSLNIDADNDLRRSGSLEIVMPVRFNSPIFEDNITSFNSVVLGTSNTRNGLLSTTQTEVWYNRYLKIYIGLEDFSASGRGQFQWCNMGCYLFDSPTEQYSATDNSISFSLLDRMAEYADQRRGIIPNISVEIPADTYNATTKQWTRQSFRKALAETLVNICGIKDYIIAPIPTEYEFLPYAIKITMGQTRLQLLTQFRDITPDWEFFFNEDGIFVYQPIPSGQNAPSLPLKEEDIISNNNEVDYSSVKNQIIVYGKTHETTFFAARALVDGTILKLSFDTLGGVNSFDTTRFTQYSKIGFTWTNFSTNTTLTNITFWKDNFSTQLFSDTAWKGNFTLVPYENNGGTYPPTQSNNVQVDLVEGQSYVIKPYYAIYNEDNIFNPNADYSSAFPALQWLGNLQAQAVSVNSQVNSPFYINGRIEGENYYGGISKLSNINPSYYDITLNDIDILGVGLTTLNIGTKITFIPRQPNDTHSKLVVNSQGVSLLEIYRSPIDFTISRAEAITPPDNYFGGDYTIWEFELILINGQLYWLVLGSLLAITAIFSDGEYNNIPSDYSAQIRADYELYLHSYLPHTVNLSMVPNYLYDVNLKLQYAPTYSALYTNEGELFSTTEINTMGVEEISSFYVSDVAFADTKQYLIKKLSFNLDASGAAMGVIAMELNLPREEEEEEPSAELNLQEKSVSITSNTTTTVEPDANYDGMSKITVDVNVPKPETATLTTSLNMISGDQVVTTSDKNYTQITIEKPTTMLSENIKKDITIGGVTGSFAEDESLPTYTGAIRTS